MAQKEATFRQAQDAVPGLNCLMEPDGAFASIGDIPQNRIALLAHEINAALRKLEAVSMPKRMTFALRGPMVDGKPGPLVHPVGADGQPNLGEVILDPERRVEYETAIAALLDETFTFELKEIRASQLRTEVMVGGKKEQRIPAGWWTTEGPEGARIRHPLGPAAVLVALAPFLVMDLEDEGA